MADGLGFSFISSPFLEKVTRDERLGREHPRKGSQTQGDRKKTGASPGEPDSVSDNDETLSSTHIDLRI
jgi:hypothetical protein